MPAEPPFTETGRYRMRCERDDLRADLPRRMRRVAVGSGFTLAVFAVALLVGGPLPAALGLAALFGIPVLVAGGLAVRDRRRLKDLDRRLEGEEDDQSSETSAVAGGDRDHPQHPRNRGT